jgi:UDP-glucose 4-epimerase
MPDSPPRNVADVGRAYRSATVAVTGGAGFIGRRLVGRLVEMGAKVTVVDRVKPDPTGPAADAEHITADLRQARATRHALSRADIVFHLAGNSDAVRSVARPQLDFEANALGTLNVARAAVTAGVSREDYLSTALVYGQQRQFPLGEQLVPAPTFPYAASKLAGENIFESFRHSYQLESVCGRAFVVYGAAGVNKRVEVHQYLDRISRGQVIHSLGDPDRKTRDFIHVDDVVSALLFLAEVPAEARLVNIGTGVETSLRQLAGLVAEALGRPVPAWRVAPSPQDEFRQVADTAKLRRLGFTPKVSLRDGIASLTHR